MILVDTSVWVEWLRNRGTLSPEMLPSLATCGPIVQEVTQGLRAGVESDLFLDRFLALPVLCDPVPLKLFRAAGEIYRQGRRRGLTIRSSVDCLVAAIAIENKVTVWHKDRDYSAIASFTPLETI